MADLSSYRRSALLNRPWITGSLYDTLSRDSVLHCDAYVFIFGKREYLQLEWREGGKKLIALDTWLIEPDGLTPVWELHRSTGVLVYSRNAALHARVIQQTQQAMSGGQWARVSVLCHYIDARETDAEHGLSIVTRKPRQMDKRNLPDIL